MGKIGTAAISIILTLVTVIIGIIIWSEFTRMPDDPAISSGEPTGRIDTPPEIRKILDDTNRSLTLNTATVLPNNMMAGVTWVPTSLGQPTPANAISSGEEIIISNGGRRTLYVCRAAHANGVHSGKLLGGQCNIGFGGQEIQKPDYEVAVYTGGSWGRKSNGNPFSGDFDPNRELQGALVGGWENNGYLYVCRVRLTENVFQTGFPFYKKNDYGWHAGKRLPNGHCHIGYGGNEYDDTNYELFYY
jgi:hypothetical protein